MRCISIVAILLSILSIYWYSQIGAENTSKPIPKDEVASISTPSIKKNTTPQEPRQNVPLKNAVYDELVTPISTSAIAKKAQPQQHLPFEHQDVDYQWADTLTTDIQDLFILNQKINHITLKDVECKSTQCFFSVYIDDASDSIHQAQVIGTLIKEKWPEYTFYLKSHPEPGMMKMEISRFNER